MSAGHGYWGRLPLPFLLDVPMALVCAPYEVTPERETVQPSTCSVNEHHFTFFWLEASVPHVWRQVYRMAHSNGGALAGPAHLFARLWGNGEAKGQCG
jgi:hypothetical protein